MIHRKWSLLTGPAAILGGIVATVVVANYIFVEHSAAPRYNPSDRDQKREVASVENCDTELDCIKDGFKPRAKYQHCCCNRIHFANKSTSRLMHNHWPSDFGKAWVTRMEVLANKQSANGRSRG